MAYNNGNWRPSYSKLPEGCRSKAITLYCCSVCGGSGRSVEDVPGGEWWETQECDCGFCEGSGKEKRKTTVKEKDYHKIMKADREACGMAYRGQA